MSQSVTDLDPMIDEISRINQIDSVNPVELPKMDGLTTEYANSNKWVCYMPLEDVLGKSYKNVELNLTRFSLPQMVMGSTTASYKGYSVEFPTKLMDAESKELTLEYIVDAKWQNYRTLYAWMSGMEGNINKVIDSTLDGISPKDYIDIRIWLIDHFKNRIIDFVFHNCWIKIFQDIALEANNEGEVHHSFTLAYSNFTIADVG